MALEPNADRIFLHERLAVLAGGLAGPLDIPADAILDADDLLVVNLRCRTCGGRGFNVGAVEPEHGVSCLTCHGSGRRDVAVVPAEAWRLLVALLRAVARLDDVARSGQGVVPAPSSLLAERRDAADACLAHPDLAAEVDRADS